MLKKNILMASIAGATLIVPHAKAMYQDDQRNPSSTVKVSMGNNKVTIGDNSENVTASTFGTINFHGNAKIDMDVEPSTIAVGHNTKNVNVQDIGAINFGASTRNKAPKTEAEREAEENVRRDEELKAFVRRVEERTAKRKELEEQEAKAAQQDVKAAQARKSQTQSSESPRRVESDFMGNVTNYSNNTNNAYKANATSESNSLPRGPVNQFNQWWETNDSDDLSVIYDIGEFPNTSQQFPNGQTFNFGGETKTRIIKGSGITAIGDRFTDKKGQSGHFDSTGEMVYVDKNGNHGKRNDNGDIIYTDKDGNTGNPDGRGNVIYIDNKTGQFLNEFGKVI